MEDKATRAVRPPVAREGWGYILGLLLVSGIFFALGWWPAAWGLVFLAGAVAFFFRDPERRVEAPPGSLLSPADGRVVAAAPEGEGSRVSIFLSLFDVHVNRSPLAGEVVAASYRPGRFLPAFRAEASRANEQNELLLRGEGLEVKVVQVAGVLARRVVCWVGPGDRVAAGERIGLIQFGSRVDVHLPPGVELRVRVGERVKGGLSVLGQKTPGGGSATAAA
ncbi:MAG: phosphatidylserine decarboxylase [Nitrospinota bacterium]